MAETGIRVARPDETKRIVATMVAAFAGDPFLRWMYPEADAYLAHFGRFVDAFAGAAFTENTAYLDEDFGGACMWLPPGVEPDGPALFEHVRTTVPSEKLAGTSEYFRQMEECAPEEDLWYLPMIGVDACFQGRGIGARLMNWSLARTDEMGIPTYLESSNPANIPFYRRLGYEPVSEIRISDDAPVMTPMYRAAR